MRNSVENRAGMGWEDPILLAILLVQAGGLAAAETVAADDRPDYPGELEVWLQPFDDKGVCSVTVGLRNLSRADQREANLQLVWRDRTGDSLTVAAVQMDPVRAGQYDAANLTLDRRCDEVAGLDVPRAEWILFQGWFDAPPDQVVRIAGVEGGRWTMRWDEGQGVFVGEKAPVD